MCMKTKESRSDILEGPVMYMKIKGLIFVTCDVHENKWTYEFQASRVRPVLPPT